MAVCNAWEVWRIRHHIVETVVIVNLTPLEGIPIQNDKLDERVSLYLQEDDLAQCLGTLEDETLAHATSAYLRIRRTE